jgi:hypothetical protein
MSKGSMFIIKSKAHFRRKTDTCMEKKKPYVWIRDPMFSDEANSSSSVSVFDDIFGNVFRFFI